MNYLVNSCSVMNNIKRNNDFYCYWLCKFQMKQYCVTVIGASPLGFAVSFGNAGMRINNCINFVFFIGLENYHRYCALATPTADNAAVLTTVAIISSALADLGFHMIFIVTNLFSQKDSAVLLQVAMCILYFNGVVEYAQI